MADGGGGADRLPQHGIQIGAYFEDSATGGGGQVTKGSTPAKKQRMCHRPTPKSLVAKWRGVRRI